MLVLEVLLWAVFLLSTNLARAIPVSTQPVEAVDYCEQVATGKNAGYVHYDVAVKCLDSFPLVPSQRTQTLDTLRKTMNFYVFEGVSMANQSSVDLLAGLDQIEAKNHTTERGFHEDLVRLFTSVHDGHLVYSPTCYSTFIYRQPFSLVSVVQNGVQKIKVTKQLLTDEKSNELFSSIAGVDLSYFAGSEVVKIDGLDPIDAITQFANENIYNGKVPSVRINQALSRMVFTNDVFGMIPGDFAFRTITPPKNHVEFTVLSPNNNQPTVIRVPWLATINNWPTELTDSASYRRLYCDVSNSSTTPAPNNNYMDATLVKRQQSGVSGTTQKLIHPIQFSTSNGTQVKFYTAGNGVGTIAIASENFNTFYDAQDFFNSLTEGFQQFGSMGIQKIILDLSDNYGGNICAGYQLINFLFPGSRFYPTNIRSTSLARALATKASLQNVGGRVWLPQTKTNYADGLKYSNSSWIDNESADFSQIFSDYCPYEFGLINSIGTPIYESQNMAVVTNGLCVSTCAVISRYLTEIHNVESIFVGGLANSTSSMVGSTGGQVYSLSSLIQTINSLGLGNHVDTPKPLVLQGDLKFPIRQIVSFDDLTQPLEFKLSLPNKHLPYSDESVYSRDLLWADVIRLLNW
ncbi:hypothetical protein K493DRAFT_385136 [Basidiobolus meristosporus CBS 931.73]|uniref:Uncharacterized protein n=1 Tax=Basidiobolus meristosporus CBS 931.73 TaxID=1314790 RepID=A0A1Y1XRU9_9FUNG|nr:hypothetical protein K493DRAFT_385136 [Basidiobolus meristosporus CBS 931.73]|eukprot:ORX88470.1 hypothetical protein K493DRAFT_385136 [Basidiobolus meristosporus CBS 931.73]